MLSRAETAKFAANAVARISIKSTVERIDSLKLFEKSNRTQLARLFHRCSGMANPINEISERIIGCAIEVHRTLGPGLLEAPYEHCLTVALVKAGSIVERQKPIPLNYEGTRVECAYRLDMLVDEQVIVEVKSVERLTNIHRAQMLSYLRLTGCQLGLVLNFNVKLVAREGVMRVANGLAE